MAKKSRNAPPMPRVVQGGRIVDGGWGRIAIASRLGETVPHQFFTSWTQMIAAGGLRAGDHQLRFPIRAYHHIAANIICRDFLTTDCDSLLFIDSDQTWQPDTLERLRDRRENHTADVCMALIVNRTSGAPITYRFSHEQEDGTPRYDTTGGWRPGEVFEVDSVGLGFTLIRRRVLERLAEPWFYHKTPETGEDVTFSQNAKAAGFRLVVDTGVEVGHLNTAPRTFSGEQAQHALRQIAIKALEAEREPGESVAVAS